MITSNNTPNYQIIAENVKGILFKNKRDRKILNVDPHVRLKFNFLAYIMRVSQNYSICWEMNFGYKNTCYGKVISEQNDFFQNTSYGPLKSKATFRPFFR